MFRLICLGVILLFMCKSPALVCIQELNNKQPEEFSFMRIATTVVLLGLGVQADQELTCLNNL